MIIDTENRSADLYVHLGDYTVSPITLPYLQVGKAYSIYRCLRKRKGTKGTYNKWNLFKYPWVLKKFLLVLSVIFVGTLVLKGGVKMLNGTGGAEGRLIWAPFITSLC
jgi:hypothetical protein